MKAKAKREFEEAAQEAESLLMGVAPPKHLELPQVVFFLVAAAPGKPRPRVRTRFRRKEAYCVSHGEAHIEVCFGERCEHKTPVVYCRACGSGCCPLEHRKRL